MSISTKNSVLAEPHQHQPSKATGPMSTIIISETSETRQNTPLLSTPTRPISKGNARPNLGRLAITRYHSTIIVHQGIVESQQKEGTTEGEEADEYDAYSDFYSPQDRDIYYDEEGYTPQSDIQQTRSDDLPPVPTYAESQMAYYPHGVKRLPHFHPQRFSKRLRNLMEQRRKPRPLYLDIEPHPKVLANSPDLLSAQHRPESLLQTLVRMVHAGPQYRQLYQGDNAVEAGYNDDRHVGSFMGIDHRVIIIGIIGLLLLGLSIGAWTVAVLRS